ncbi:2-oxoglutarate dehydrogenase E1 component [Hirschia litorea]|uniref:2-oxoglutarate dehydrogenase E1 component n=1 Tax=Hirschia litorea TaxID=1199156 RepID=A0ABW2IK24_9PROT
MTSQSASGNNERSKENADMLDTAFLYGGNAVYIEQLYAQYVEDPTSISADWRDFFDKVGDPAIAAKQAAAGPAWSNKSWPKAQSDELISALDGDWAKIEPVLKSKIEKKQPAGAAASTASSAPASSANIHQQVQDSIRALMMIRAYRIRGHLAANLDPLGIEVPSEHPELSPKTYGFEEADMDREIYIDHVLGLEYASPRKILEILKRTYCSTFGVQFMHIADPEEKSWIQQRIEGEDKEIEFTAEGRIAILTKLLEAETFERFLHKRYPGTKRFGLDGGEAAVPALEQIIKRGGALGVDEIILGMPHRGRLNVLAAVMGKPYHIIFNEFQGGNTQGADDFGSGDVKYHLGASSDREFDGNKVHLSLTANPSHLEAVNPVVLGKARAKQSFDLQEDRQAERVKVMPLLLHGDAAFAGQGVVSECFALSGLAGYRTGGTIHFIVNNQIGFTTSPKYSRSSPYPTDVALQVQAPIFHVNGDDPEAVVHAAKVATEYRQKFGKDVVIDMFCYRRFGHNEGDEPMFTQPLMYKKISGQKSTREIYSDKLVQAGVITEQGVDQIVKELETFLDQEFEKGKTYKAASADWLDGAWSGFGLPAKDDRRGRTSLEMDRLKALGANLTTIPNSVVAHKTVKKVYDQRAKMITTGEGIDWATAEMLAFGSLVSEGFPVRLSGQDSGRGTFSQRHSHIVDQNTEARYTPLRSLRHEQADYEVIDSLLSEEAVLGYEYGYSLAAPNTLTLWEAQFGDFANGAQVVFDQFLSCGERKWLRMSGLVCLLPHGYEGQGPEHSSARLERFLQLCAQDNMQVANCTTPANYFHILRRQIHRDFRKPLILMTPKSLLRHKLATSALSDMAEGSSFHRVLWDDAETDGRQGKVELVKDDKIRRVIMCSGKVYYDLFEEREARGIKDVYLLRLEQLYPFPVKPLMEELKRFKNADMVWCQEEPKNMGAWTFVDPNIERVLERLESKATRARYVGRAASASTAAGNMGLHKKELAAFLDAAFEE